MLFNKLYIYIYNINFCNNDCMPYSRISQAKNMFITAVNILLMQYLQIVIAPEINLRTLKISSHGGCSSVVE